MIARIVWVEKEGHVIAYAVTDVESAKRTIDALLDM